MQYSTDELKEICLKHIKWINDEEGGERADLRGADLRGADLLGVNLCDANLRGANLCDANLCDANLLGADLCDANLCDANLRGADLRGADLLGADLCDANLCDANLLGANLCDANLRDANLRGANLCSAKNAEHAQAQTYIVPEGSIIGWKKADSPDGGYCIVKLRIPEDAKRSNATGRKCRAEFADVLEIIGAEYAVSNYDKDFKYEVGKRVIPNKFDENRWVECSNGIHFFITRLEAEAYIL